MTDESTGKRCILDTLHSTYHVLVLSSRHDELTAKRCILDTSHSTYHVLVLGSRRMVGRYGHQLPEERGDELVILSMYPCCIEINML